MKSTVGFKEKECIFPRLQHAWCILGVDVVENCDTQSLTLGYQTFRDEALNINPDYQATTVNTDG